ncbi:tRNA (adenine(22)-N(1))-methyltransferase TrmK [Pontibacterium granulatum]|uniref:tRNA (adenine(22)-N(1))-methyltransferase n=1 Tax=Pontibacterium granulatum TaxID=2036029 RepID=UPI00249CC6E2|nr:tRNA (adenine(22)-N(1))-methyltransferase TrmK [Pontibacterium granulatum]MDI3325572.1 tRNA (adenine(22)-N(1))-methyltransferase TrmK [Pontibacterium granulatum]
MKLSHRLEQINRMVTDHYDHIWDCCCDHGFLGATLLQRGAADTVHFVDVVPSLTEALEVQLARFLPDFLKGRDWQVHCMDVSTLTLPESPGRQLIIIAGVGGDLTLEMVQAITLSHPNRELEFMLCPVRQHYLLRQGLIHLGYGLVDEALVCENKRFYEAIHVSSGSNQVISPVGDQMWDLSRALDREYITRTIAHYERMGRNADQEAEQILGYYRGLLAM